MIRKGYEAIYAATAAEALRLCDEGAFDLLICDIGLPDVTGWKLVHDIKQKCKMKSIALSGFGMVDDIEKSRLAGFDAHVLKPIDFPSFERTLADVMMNIPK